MNSPGAAGRMRAKWRSAICCGAAVCGLGFSFAVWAQSAQATPAPRKTTHAGRQISRKRRSLKHKEPASPPPLGQIVRTVPNAPAASELGVRRATVTLKDGILIVQANNSDLGRILYDVAQISGTTIHGSIKSVRVYGVYGPRSPRDVLSDLLAGSGYNFMMVGLTSQGAPRDLVLTPKGGDALAGTTVSPAAPSLDGHESADANIPDEDPPGPGAILHAPPAPTEDLNERVDQHLRRLQQMQDQQKPGKPPQ
jgi:hypothetical protein